MLFDLIPAPSLLFSYLFVLVIAFTVHEFAHAWTADRYGDDTPRLNGRLTLNPFAHLDPIGSLLLIFAGFGWAKPVPVNPYALQRRSSAALMWVSLAGPLSNLLMAIVAAIPFRLGLISRMEAELALWTAGEHILPTIPQLLFVFVSTNLLLMLFNMIPLAPLDGEKVAEYLLPANMSRILTEIRPYGPLILIMIVIVPPYLGFDVIGRVLNPLMNMMMNLLMG